jgi:hypothetical protein
MWWRALLKAEDPLAVAWRQALLDFEAPDRVLSHDMVEAFLGQLATRIEERLLHETGPDGRWQPQPHRQPVQASPALEGADVCPTTPLYQPTR